MEIPCCGTYGGGCKGGWDRNLTFDPSHNDNDNNGGDHFPVRIWPRTRAFTPRVAARSEAHLAVAGEGGVVKQEVGTEEEDDGVEHTQARPVEEDGPAEEGVLRYVPAAARKVES